MMWGVEAYERLYYFTKQKINMNIIKKLLPQNTSDSADVSVPLLIVRLWLGFMMMRYTYTIIFSSTEMADVAKYLEGMNFPIPLLMAYLSKSAEFFGGALILIGMFTRISATFLVINFIVAVFIANGNNILGAGALAFNYLILSLIVMLLGAGRYSLDWTIFTKKA